VKADVINISWGFSSVDFEISREIKAAHRKGIIIAAAARNQGFNTEIAWSAAMANGSGEVICANSATSLGHPSSFNPGTQPRANIFVCGEDIESVWPSGGLRRESGTSYAAPILSAIAAGLLEYMDHAKDKTSYSVEENGPTKEDLLQSMRNSSKMADCIREYFSKKKEPRVGNGKTVLSCDGG
jgi:subtilisin family serine protease